MFTHSHLAHTLMNNFHWPRAATWTSTCCLNTSLAHTPTNDLRWPTSRAATWTSTCGLKRTSVTCSPTGSSLQTRSPPHCLCTNGGCASCMHHVALCVHAMEIPPLLVYKWWVCFMHASCRFMCPCNGIPPIACVQMVGVLHAFITMVHVSIQWACVQMVGVLHAFITMLNVSCNGNPPIACVQMVGLLPWKCFMHASCRCMCPCNGNFPIACVNMVGVLFCIHHSALCIHASKIPPPLVFKWLQCFYTYATVLSVYMHGLQCCLYAQFCTGRPLGVLVNLWHMSSAHVDRLVCLPTSGTCRAHMSSAWCACQPLAL